MWQQIKALCPNAHPNQMIMDSKRLQSTALRCLACHVCEVLLLPPHTERLAESTILGTTIRLQPGCRTGNTHPPASSPLAFAAPHEVPNLFGDIVQQLPMPQAPVWSYISRTPISGEHYQAALTRRCCFPLKCGIINSTPNSDYPGQLILLRHGTVLLMQLLGAIILQF